MLLLILLKAFKVYYVQLIKIDNKLINPCYLTLREPLIISVLKERRHILNLIRLTKRVKCVIYFNLFMSGIILILDVSRTYYNIFQQSFVLSPTTHYYIYPELK